MSSSTRTALTLGSLAGVWWLLSGGEPASWMIGLPTVIATGWAVRRLGPAQAGALWVRGLLRFIPFFLWESLRGGVDVALALALLAAVAAAALTRREVDRG